MTFYTYRPVQMGPGENIVYRANPTSALNTFAAAGMYGRAARSRSRFRRRVPGVTDINATLIAFGPLTKADEREGLVISSTVTDDFNLIKSSGGEISETERKIALATNAAGAVAGPGLLYMALKSARKNEGGLPRGIARSVSSSKRFAGTKAGGKVRRVVQSLDKPMTPKHRAAAVAAGAGLVGLQMANTTGDFIAARAMANAERSKKE